jgi:hypothetical protein
VSIKSPQNVPSVISDAVSAAVPEINASHVAPSPGTLKPSAFIKGQSVEYQATSKGDLDAGIRQYWKPALVVAVHVEAGEEDFYTIRLDSGEKQTVGQRLRLSDTSNHSKEELISPGITFSTQNRRKKKELSDEQKRLLSRFK